MLKIYQKVSLCVTERQKHLEIGQIFVHFFAILQVMQRYFFISILNIKFLVSRLVPDRKTDTPGLG
jgi:hypothetical protein